MTTRLKLAPGRKKMLAGQRRRNRVTVNLTDAEYRELIRAAGALTVTSYLRGLVLLALSAPR